MSSHKIRVLFVGSFKEMSKDGHVGGQMFACKNLINSELSDTVEWILLDSTADSNLNAFFVIRLFKALKRIIKFIYLLVFKRPNISLIFTANGWSFIEKGLMVIISRITHTKVALAPRAGILIDEIEGNSLFHKYLSTVFTYADMVICQSESWKAKFIQLTKLPEDKFEIVYNFIDATKYKQIIQTDAINDKSETKIIFLGWIDRSKGIFELIESIRKVKTKHTQIKLTILGNGKDFNAAILMTQKLLLEEIIEFRSWVFDQDKINALQSSQIYVLPSYSEGFPNALLEAMACGLAPIVTSVGAIPDIIRHKENGWIIPPKNTIALYEALDALIENKELRKNMGMKARETVINNYSLESGIKKYKEIFKKIEYSNSE